CDTTLKATTPDLVAIAVEQVANTNAKLDEPGFVFNRDGGTIEYRARLFAGADGGLDEEVLRAELLAALGCIDKHVPEMRLWVACHSVELPEAFSGYVE